MTLYTLRRDPLHPNEEAISDRTGQNMALLGTTLAGRPRAWRSAIRETMTNIRVESQEDIHQVHLLNEQAFEQPAEASIVDKLRLACPEYLSLVAEDDRTIVGHILFTPVVIE
ncbi:MAG: hypothetical protein GY799_34700, partial [Desulfobulbaceae bacterium]|nr:hypothetical protein [Desulfobulbaceae bacterium]